MRKFTLVFFCLALSLWATIHHSNQVHVSINRVHLAAGEGETTTLFVDATLVQPVTALHEVRLLPGSTCVLHAQAVDVVGEVTEVAAAPGRPSVRAVLELRVDDDAPDREVGREVREVTCRITRELNFFRSGIRVPSTVVHSIAVSDMPHVTAVRRTGPLSTSSLGKGSVMLDQPLEMSAEFPRSSLATELYALLASAELTMESYVAYGEASSGAFEVSHHVNGPVALKSDDEGNVAFSVLCSMSGFLELPKAAALFIKAVTGKNGDQEGSADRVVTVAATDPTSLFAKILGDTHSVGWRSKHNSTSHSMAREMGKRLGHQLLGLLRPEDAPDRLLQEVAYVPPGHRTFRDIALEETIFMDDTELDISGSFHADEDEMSLKVEIMGEEQLFDMQLTASGGDTMKLRHTIVVPDLLNMDVSLSWTDLYEMQLDIVAEKTKGGEKFFELYASGYNAGDGKDIFSVAMQASKTLMTVRLEDNNDNLDATFRMEEDGATQFELSGGGQWIGDVADLLWQFKVPQDGLLQTVATVKTLMTSKDEEFAMDFTFTADGATTDALGGSMSMSWEDEDQSLLDRLADLWSLEANFDFSGSLEILDPAMFGGGDMSEQVCLQGSCSASISASGKLLGGPADLAVSLSSRNTAQDVEWQSVQVTLKETADHHDFDFNVMSKAGNESTLQLDIRNKGEDVQMDDFIMTGSLEVYEADTGEVFDASGGFMEMQVQEDYVCVQLNQGALLIDGVVLEACAGKIPDGLAEEGAERYDLQALLNVGNETTLKLFGMWENNQSGIFGSISLEADPVASIQGSLRVTESSAQSRMLSEADTYSWDLSNFDLQLQLQVYGEQPSAWNPCGDHILTLSTTGASYNDDFTLDLGFAEGNATMNNETCELDQKELVSFVGKYNGGAIRANGTIEGNDGLWRLVVEELVDGYSAEVSWLDAARIEQISLHALLAENSTLVKLQAANETGGQILDLRAERTGTYLFGELIASLGEDDALDRVWFNVSHTAIAHPNLTEFQVMWLEEEFEMDDIVQYGKLSLTLTPEDGVHDFTMESKAWRQGLADAPEDMIYTIQIISKNPYDFFDGQAQVTTMAGSLTITVENATEFAADAKVVTAMKKAIAAAVGAGLAEEDVTVVFTVVPDSERRLDTASPERRLAGVVTVDYVIRVASTADDIVDVPGIQESLEMASADDLTTKFTSNLRQVAGQDVVDKFAATVSEVGEVTVSTEFLTITETTTSLAPPTVTKGGGGDDLVSASKKCSSFPAIQVSWLLGLLFASRVFSP